MRAVEVCVLEIGIVGLLRERHADGFMQLVYIIGDEVCQVAILCVIPNGFSWIKFGGVGRQELDGQPSRTRSLETPNRRFVDTPAIHDENDRRLQMVMQLSQEGRYLHCIDVMVMDLEVEADVCTTRREA